MISSLKDKLLEAFRPVAIIRYANRHYRHFPIDEFDRRSITKLKIASDGALTVGSLVLWASLYPMENGVTEACLTSGKALISTGMIYSAVLGWDLYKYGKAELARVNPPSARPH